MSLETRVVREYGPFRSTTEIITVLNSMLQNPQVLRWQINEMEYDISQTLIVRWQIMKDVFKTTNPKGESVNAGIIDDAYYLFVELRLFRWPDGPPTIEAQVGPL